MGGLLSVLQHTNPPQQTTPTKPTMSRTHTSSRMPTRKHVHFAARDQVRIMSPAPATPSPSWSDISLPDSDGPSTPPQAHIPLPPPAKSAPQIHGALAFRPAALAALDWDLSRLPSKASIDGSSGSRFRAALAEPATNPPTHSMTLVSDLLPYAIPVHAGAATASSSPYAGGHAPLPSSRSRAPKATYVTVHDVLAAVYAFLRIPISGSEYSRLSSSRQAAVANAYQRRVARIADSRDRAAEHAKGVKRIDLLIAAGRTRFVGLAATKGREVWVLNVG